MIAEFCEQAAVHGYSRHTVKARRTLLARWLAERGVSRPAEVTRPMLEGYQRSLFHHRKADGSPLAFSTQLQRLVAARTFFEWLVRGNRILHDPAAGLVSQTGFDGDLEARIPPGGREPIKPCHERGSTSMSCWSAALGWSSSPAARLPT